MPRRYIFKSRTSRFALPPLSQTTSSLRPTKPDAGVGGTSPSARSLYRIFLRATSASLLHHSAGTRCLRSRYRPIFEQYFRLHQSSQRDNKSALDDWEARMDNTLRLLQNSATSRGLPDQLTRNLSSLIHARFMDQKHASHPKWDPNRKSNAAKDDDKAALNARLDRYMQENLELGEGLAKLALGR